jgi:hypothetical protein
MEERYKKYKVGAIETFQVRYASIFVKDLQRLAMLIVDKNYVNTFDNQT